MPLEMMSFTRYCENIVREYSQMSSDLNFHIFLNLHLEKGTSSKQWFAACPCLLKLQMNLFELLQAARL